MLGPARRLAILSVVITLALATFTWPAARLEPRDLPVGVTGPVPAALADPAAFDLHRYESVAAARTAVRERDVYGAVAGRTLYVASGASPAVAAALHQAAPGTRVVDLAPGTRADPRIATLGALALPVTILGIITAILAFLTGRSTRERVGVIAASGAIAGAMGALLTQTWLDALPGAWLAIAGTVGLAVTAVAATVTGLASHLGRPGIGLGAVLMMFVGNPWSGLTSAPELLPQAAGAIGQHLPTGAAGNLLRSVAYFDGAGAGPFLVVLGAWAVAGLALIGTAALRGRPVPSAHHAAPAHA